MHSSPSFSCQILPRFGQEQGGINWPLALRKLRHGQVTRLAQGRKGLKAKTRARMWGLQLAVTPTEQRGGGAGGGPDAQGTAQWQRVNPMSKAAPGAPGPAHLPEGPSPGPSRPGPVCRAASSRASTHIYTVAPLHTLPHTHSHRSTPAHHTTHTLTLPPVHALPHTHTHTPYHTHHTLPQTLPHSLLHTHPPTHSRAYRTKAGKPVSARVSLPCQGGAVATGLPSSKPGLAPSSARAYGHHLTSARLPGAASGPRPP